MRVKVRGKDGAKRRGDARNNKSVSQKEGLTMKKMILLGLSAAMLAFLPMQEGHAKTLKWSFQGDVATLDPYAHAESFTGNFLHHIYEPLVRRGRDLSFEPALASGWELVEPTVWRFKLREGVKFHDGKSFDADDVVASLDRIRHPDARQKGYAQAIKDVRKVDQFTVDIETKGAYPLLLNDLSGIFMMCHAWLKEHNAEQPVSITTGQTTFASSNTNGTGPFKLESYRADQKAVMTVNTEWWDTPEHNLTRIEFTPIKADATRIAALLSGEVDLVLPASLQDIQRINSASGFKVLELPSVRTIFFGFNIQADELNNSDVKGKNPLSDPKVRKALWMGIDSEQLTGRIMRGKARTAGVIAAPEMPGYSPELDVRPPYDPEAAKALLAEAGYPDGFSTNLSCSNDRYVNDEPICVAVTAMWARIGVTANLTTESKTTYFPKIDRGEADIFMFGYAALPAMDGFSILTAQLSARKDGRGQNNFGGYDNPAIEEIVAKAAVEQDNTKRLALITEALRISNEEVAYLPLHQQPIAWAVRDGIDVPQFADEYLRLWFAKVD